MPLTYRDSSSRSICYHNISIYCKWYFLRHNTQTDKFLLQKHWYYKHLNIYTYIYIYIWGKHTKTPHIHQKTTSQYINYSLHLATTGTIGNKALCTTERVLLCLRSYHGLSVQGEEVRKTTRVIWNRDYWMEGCVWHWEPTSLGRLWEAEHRN